LRPIVKSDSYDFMRHYVRDEDALAIQIPIGPKVAADDDVESRPLSTRGAPASNLFWGKCVAAHCPLLRRGLLKVLPKP